MTWIVLVVITILALVTVSFMSGSSHFYSQPGAKADLSFLGIDKLLTPKYDGKKHDMLQDKHNEVAKLVSLANFYYKFPFGLEAAAKALLEAVECYEAIRKQANSAVVEFNLALLTKARIKVEHELGDDPKLMKELNDYVDNAIHWAGWLLKQEDHEYDLEVQRRYGKLKQAQDVRK